MRTFTDSPFERMMQEIPRAYRPEPYTAPPGSACRECSYWRGMPCVGTCYRELTATQKEAETSGRNVQKSRPV